MVNGGILKDVDGEFRSNSLLLSWWRKDRLQAVSSNVSIATRYVVDLPRRKKSNTE